MTSTDIMAGEWRVRECQGLIDIPDEQQWSQVCESGTLHVWGQSDQSRWALTFFASRGISRRRRLSTTDDFLAKDFTDGHEKAYHVPLM